MNDRRPPPEDPIALYARWARVAGYFMSALFVVTAFVVAADSLLVSFAFAAVGVGTFYAVRHLHSRATRD